MADDQPGPTAPLPAPPPGVGPPSEALAGFWVRLAAAFIDWLLVGILASAIGALFGLDTFTPPPAGTRASASRAT